MDDLGLEQSDHGLGESIFVRATDAADGGFDARFSKAPGVSDAHVLRSAVGVADKTAACEGVALMQSLLQGIEDEVRPRRARHALAHDPASENIDDESRIDEAAPGSDVGQTVNPKPVQALRLELPVDPVE